MFESSYLIDPGAHTLRIYDPKSKKVHSLRSCRLFNRPGITGDEAIKASWDESDHLVYPFSQEKIKADPAPLLQSLFATIPAERYLLIPDAAVLSFSLPGEELEEAWNRLLHPYKIARIRMIPAFAPEDGSPFFHIHAGASQVHFVMGKDKEVIDWMPISEAGNEMDKAIAREIARVFQVLISQEDACALKEAVSNALSQSRNPVLSVTGLSSHNEYVKIRFRAADLWGCMEPVLLEIARQAAAFVCRKGPELMEQVLTQPVLVSGGLAPCYGLIPLLRRSLHASLQIVPNPQTWLLDTLARRKTPFFGRSRVSK